METIHASAVAVDGKGVLIRGASGAGKSSLAWGMMSHGAKLISDDQVVLSAAPVILRAPAAIRGLIEARGVGLLRAPTVEAPLALLVNLDATSEKRLPDWDTCEINGQRVPVVHKTLTPLLPYILVHYVMHGRQE